MLYSDSNGEKPWQDIYPEISPHTSGVSGPARRATDAAIAYALTGEKKYAETVRKVLLHYTKYQFFARHPDVGMNIIYDTVSDADRRAIDDFFQRALAAVVNNDKEWLREGWGGGPFNNHNAHRKLFIGSYGLFYGKQEYIDYAMNGEQGFRDLIEKASRDDGLWLESSISYHFTGVGPIATFAMELANAGHALDLWNDPLANRRRLRDYFFAPIQTLFPDGTIPTIGDTYGRRSTLRGNRGYFGVFNAFPDPLLGWVLRDAEPGTDALFLKLMARRKATSTVFVSALQAERGAIPDVKVTVRDDRYDLLRVTVNCRGVVREFLAKKISAQ